MLFLWWWLLNERADDSAALNRFHPPGHADAVSPYLERNPYTGAFRFSRQKRAA